MVLKQEFQNLSSVMLDLPVLRFSFPLSPPGFTLTMRGCGATQQSRGAEAKAAGLRLRRCCRSFVL